MNLTEAEIQVLASIAVLEADGRATTCDIVEQRGEACWTYKEDWSNAFETLIAEGLIRESREDYLPDIAAGRLSRYLYLVSR